jgi:hypothetical protein
VIIFKSKSIAKNVMFYLDKDVNEFSAEEINTIKELSVDGGEEVLDLSEALVFNNLEELIISNTFLSKDDILVLGKLPLLRTIYFNKCFFENSNVLDSLNIKELNFYDCDIISYSFLNNMSFLEKLSIVDGEVSLNDFNGLGELNKLRLSHSHIHDICEFDFPKLEELYINDTNIVDYSILNNLSNLRVIDLSGEMCENWSSYVDDLNKKKVLVLENGFPYNRG